MSAAWPAVAPRHRIDLNVVRDILADLVPTVCSDAPIEAVRNWHSSLTLLRKHLNPDDLPLNEWLTAVGVDPTLLPHVSPVVRLAVGGCGQAIALLYSGPGPRTPESVDAAGRLLRLAASALSGRSEAMPTEEEVRQARSAAVGAAQRRPPASAGHYYLDYRRPDRPASEWANWWVRYNPDASEADRSEPEAGQTVDAASGGPEPCRISSGRKRNRVTKEEADCRTRLWLSEWLTSRGYERLEHVPLADLESIAVEQVANEVAVPESSTYRAAPIQELTRIKEAKRLEAREGKGVKTRPLSEAILAALPDRRSDDPSDIAAANELAEREPEVQKDLDYWINDQKADDDGDNRPYEEAAAEGRPIRRKRRL